jgi:hypothetical protein
MKSKVKSVAKKTAKPNELKELQARVKALTLVVIVLAQAHQQGDALVKQLL